MASIKVIDEKTGEAIKEFPLDRTDESGNWLCQEELQNAVDFASNNGGYVFFEKQDKLYDTRR